MQEYDTKERSPIGLDAHGLSNLKSVFWNPSTPAIYEEALKRSHQSIQAADLVWCEQAGGAAPQWCNDADFGIEPDGAGGHAELFGDSVGGQHAGLVAGIGPGCCGICHDLLDCVQNAGWFRHVIFSPFG